VSNTNTYAIGVSNTFQGDVAVSGQREWFAGGCKRYKRPE
jgi:hypothetical protein